MPQATRRRERILTRARRLLAEGRRPTVSQIAAAAGTSKAGFYREFESRAALFDALRLEPEPATRERILAAAFQMVGGHGLEALSMDDLATRSSVSRATLYRLFPGKPALFVSLVRAYTPLEPVSRKVIAMQAERPEVVMPELARTIYRAVAGPNAPQIGMLRTLFFEVSGLSPDAEAAAQELLATVFGSVGAYVVGQMADGRLRPLPPLLALQAFIGPIFFHLMTSQVAHRVLGIDLDGEAAVTTLAEGWLRAMKPDAQEGE